MESVSKTEIVSGELTEEELKSQYEKRVEELQEAHGWSKRKARRAMESNSRKILKKLNKKREDAQHV